MNIGEDLNMTKIRKAINNPNLIKSKTKEFAQRAYFSKFSPHYRIHKYRFERKHGKEKLIIDEDWDFPIILDACRYDSFVKLNDIEGELNRFISAGSHSAEFAKKNFQNRELNDTVYITANPHGAKLGEKTFHDLIFTEREGESYWPSRNGKHPESIVETALDACAQHPNKKLIIHFMQPHSPYYGEKAEKLRSKLVEDGITGWSSQRDKHNLKNAIRRGHISISELQEVYEENLIFVLDYVKELLGHLEGKSIITSDHGELLGEQSGLWKYADFRRQTPAGIPIGHPKKYICP